MVNIDISPLLVVSQKVMPVLERRQKHYPSLKVSAV
jgi:hypothetical protein